MSVNSVKTVGVALGKTDPFGVDAIAKYEAELLRSNAAGTKIKALVLCNPHNPLGAPCSFDD